MNQVRVIKVQSSPILRKYPGVPKVPENITAVRMNTYQDKNPNDCYVLKLVKKDNTINLPFSGLSVYPWQGSS